MTVEREKVWLTAEQVDRMLELARNRMPSNVGLRDHALLLLLRYGLRVGEIVGNHDLTRYSVWVDPNDHGKGREQRESIVDLPGIHYEDIQRSDRSVWIKGKGRKPIQYYLPRDAMDALVLYVSQTGYGAGARIFQLSVTKAEQLVQEYAEQAGVPRCREKGFGCHRLRAFFATDARDKGLSAFEIRDAMRHSRIETTQEYVGRSTPAQLRAMMDRLGAD